MKTPIVIALPQLKGGVGKSFTALNLAAGLARRRRVLLLDLDAGNRSVTNYFPATPHWVGDVLAGTVSVADAAVAVRPNLFTISASADVRLPWENVANLDLAYDYVVLDCPGGDHAPTRAAIQAATLCVLCVNGQLELESALATQALIEQMRPDWAGSRVLRRHVRYLQTAWLVRAGNKADMEAISALPLSWFKARILHSVKCSAFATNSQTVFDAGPPTDKRLRENYADLADEIARLRL